MSNLSEEEIIDVFETIITVNRFSGIYTDIGIIIDAMKGLLDLYKQAKKRVDELENHVHYKNCAACGKEFKAKRKDAKYCVYCSKYMNNRNYYLGLTKEQKAKRREQAKMSMRKLRAKDE